MGLRCQCTWITTIFSAYIMITLPCLVRSAYLTELLFDVSERNFAIRTCRSCVNKTMSRRVSIEFRMSILYYAMYVFAYYSRNSIGRGQQEQQQQKSQQQRGHIEMLKLPNHIRSLFRRGEQLHPTRSLPQLLCMYRNVSM